MRTKLYVTISITNQAVALYPEVAIREQIARAGSQLLYEAIINPKYDPVGHMEFSARHDSDYLRDIEQVSMMLTVEEIVPQLPQQPQLDA